MAGLLESGVMQPGPTVYAQNQLRKQKGTRGLLEAVGGPMSYAPNPAVAAIGQGLLGARYLTGEADPTEGAKSLSDMTAMAIGSRLPAPLRNIITYHGSPHKFDKFDSSKIGTGEGAQAYGHGLYLAEAPTVAKSYVDPLYKARDATQIGGLQYDAFLDNARKAIPTTTKDRVLFSKAMAPAQSLEEAAANLAELKKLEPGRDFRNVDALFELASKSGVDFPAKGNLYKVDLPDSAVAKMLDWDEPLSQQAPEVQKAIRPLLDELNPQVAAQVKTGSDLWAKGMNKYMGNRGTYEGVGVELSKRLKDAGIPGIRYLDGGSRGAGQGTRNYVVFPGEEGLLNILERNGQPLLGR